nr:MAG: putative replicase protein [Leviviridae sp.]
MGNSHSQYLLGLAAAICEDVCCTFPRLRKELKRDLSRLGSFVETRGLRVLTIDLPAAGKDFDQSLSAGQLRLASTFITARKRKSSPIPRLFGALVSLVFDDSGILRQNADHKAIQFLRQLYAFGKKWRAKCDDSFTFEEVREFFRVDEQLDRPVLRWVEPYVDGWKTRDLHLDNLYNHQRALSQENLPGFNSERFDLVQSRYGSHTARHSDLVRTCQRVMDIVSTTLGWFEPGRVLAQHGPGVVSDLKVGSSKYEFPIWSERLEGVFQQARFAFANYGLWADFVHNEHGDDSDNGRPNTLSSNRFVGVETYSKLIAVPKTQKGPRLIAAEPTANQWCQQIVRRFLYERVAHSWIGKFITFDDQTHNQDMALAASKDASMSTIDLKAASDRISLRLVEAMFRGNSTILNALHASRTLYIRNPIDKKSSEFHILNKFSTMGSAVTFPVQSLIFLAICLAASLHEDNVKPTIRSVKGYAGRIRVFGDDIIVPTEHTECVKYLLQYLGFQVNTSKTFHGSGMFRESCGVEAYGGSDVTPCYALTVPAKTVPYSLVSSVATAHNFALRGYWYVAEFIKRATHKAGLVETDLPFVEPGSGTLGWPSPMGSDWSHLRSRWNHDLQRIEFFIRRVQTRTTKLADRGASKVLQYFVENPLPTVSWQSGVPSKVRVLTRRAWVSPQD